MQALFDFDDILIQPARLTNINSRKEIDIFDENGMLPIFTAPMDMVVQEHNMNPYLLNKINVALPRKPYGTYTVDDYSSENNIFVSYGLREFKDLFLIQTIPIPSGYKIYALIDVANGHMPGVINTVNEAKNKYGEQLVLMVGNIANPETFYALSQAGADYIRVGIGNGGGCLTTQQTGVGYPMGSLIAKTAELKGIHSLKAKIVADGGFKKYADVIKALALGADYVMLGSIFNKALESSGELYINRGVNPMPIDSWRDKARQLIIPGDSEATLSELMYDGILYKMFRGMSTKEAQLSLGNEELKTSEGVVKYQKVEYTLAGWCDNFEHYLRSAMSYTDSENLNTFIGKVKYNIITQNSFNRYNK